jgi:ankyrin repeat protein
VNFFLPSHAKLKELFMLLKRQKIMNGENKSVAKSLEEFLANPTELIPCPEILTSYIEVLLFVSNHCDYVNIEIQDDTILTLSIRTLNVGAVNAVLSAGVDPNLVNRKGLNPLSAAAQKGNIEIIKSLILAGAEVNGANVSGSTALIQVVLYIVHHLYFTLFQASHFGYLSAVQLLLEFGSKADFANIKGTTALMRSSQEGHVEISQLLVDSHGDVNKKNLEGMNALMLASQRGHHEVVLLLIKAGAVMDEQTSQVIYYYCHLTL